MEATSSSFYKSGSLFF